MATSAQIRQQLVEALQLDLIGPGWDDVARRHEQLPQPPSIWYTTGFLVPNSFQEEAGRPPEGEAPSYADQAGEDPSNDAAIRQEDREGDDDATGSSPFLDFHTSLLHSHRSHRPILSGNPAAPSPCGWLAKGCAAAVRSMATCFYLS